MLVKPGDELRRHCSLNVVNSECYIKTVFSPFKFKNDSRKLGNQDGLLSIDLLGYGMHAGEEGDDFRRVLIFLFFSQC
jgi:hypothetical protein